MHYTNMNKQVIFKIIKGMRECLKYNSVAHIKNAKGQLMLTVQTVATSQGCVNFQILDMKNRNIASRLHKSMVKNGLYQSLPWNVVKLLSRVSFENKVKECLSLECPKQTKLNDYYKTWISREPAFVFGDSFIVYNNSAFVIN